MPGGMYVFYGYGDHFAVLLLIQLRATDYFPFVAYFAHRAVQRVKQSDRSGGRPARENED